MTYDADDRLTAVTRRFLNEEVEAVPAPAKHEPATRGDGPSPPRPDHAEPGPCVDRSDPLTAFLEAIAKVPASLTRIYERLGHDTKSGSKLRRQAEASQLIAIHKFACRGRGAPLRVAELLPAGHDWLQSAGVKVARPTGAKTGGGGGGFAHRVGCDTAIAVFGGRGWHARKEVHVPEADVRLDALLRNADADQTVIQVGVSDAGREVAAWARLLPLAAFDGQRLVMVCLDRAFEDAFKTQLARAVATEQAERIETHLIGDLLKEATQ